MNARPAALAGLLAVAWSLAACGSTPQRAAKTTESSTSGAPSASRLLGEARAAAYGARTVRVGGSIKSERGPITIDVEIVANHGGSGHVVLNRHPLELTVFDGHTYVRAGARLYTEAGATSPRLAGRWVEIPAGTPAARGLESLTSLTDLLGAALSPHGRLYSDGTTSVAGVAAERLRDSGSDGSLLIEASAPHYPLAFEGPPAGGTRIRLSGWNQPAHISPPPRAQTLGGGSR